MEKNLAKDNIMIKSLKEFSTRVIYLSLMQGTSH